MLLKVGPKSKEAKWQVKSDSGRSNKKKKEKEKSEKNHGDYGFLGKFKVISKEFCEESSICGLKKLVDSKCSIYERIIWAAVMLTSLACSAALATLTIGQFANAPLVTTQLPDGVPVNSVLFPTISVCTTNRISRRAVTQLAETLVSRNKSGGRNITETLELLSTLGRLYDLEITNITNLHELHKILEDYDINSLLSWLTPECKNILVDCMWEATRRDCAELFDTRLTMNGFCCTFNYMRDSDEFVERIGRTIDMYNFGNKSNFGYNMGLRLLLNLSSSDDFYTNNALFGALITLTDAYDFPDASSGSLRLQVVTPERQMSLSLYASVTEASRDIQHVPIELRGCLFYDESSYLPLYTNSDCLLKCRVLFIFERCGCMPFNVPKMAGARTCGLGDVVCLHNYAAQSIAVQAPAEVAEPAELELHLLGGGINCSMCYPTCSKTVVTVVPDAIKLYPEFFNQVPDSEREPWLRGINFSELSLLSVQYGDEKASAYEQNIVMKWFDIVSNIGSTCGFVTGFSFVSLFEFFYFFTFRLFRATTTKHHVAETNRGSGVTKVEDHNSMKLKTKRIQTETRFWHSTASAHQVDVTQTKKSDTIFWGEHSRDESKNVTITGTYSSHFS